MPLKVNHLRLPVEEPESALQAVLARRLGVNREELVTWRILRKSLDARSRSHLEFVYSAVVELSDEPARLAALKKNGEI